MLSKVVLFIFDLCHPIHFSFDTTPRLFVQVFSSSDMGVTWGAPSVFKITVPKPFSPSLIPAVGHGLVLSADLCTPSCRQTGRLLLPMVCTNTSHAAVSADKGACPTCNSCIIVSDDDGKTWTFAAFGQVRLHHTACLGTAREETIESPPPPSPPPP